MKANQLRIGNYLNFEQTTHIVSGVLENGETNSYWVNKGLKDSFYEYSAPMDHYKPIPLNEDWLLKLGFKKVIYKTVHPDWCNEICYELEHKEFFISYLDDFSMGLYVQKTTHQNDLSIVPSLENMKYVHQLQNLYFALTGEELKLIEIN